MKFAINARLSRFGFGFLGVVLAAFISLPAQAVPLTPTPPYSVFTFAGNCTDCAAQADEQSHPVNATLTLQNYVTGSGNSPVSSFFSLAYGGSNLIDAFTLHANEQLNVNSDPFGFGTAAVFFYVTGYASQTTTKLDGQQMYFRSFADGNWDLGLGNGFSGDEDFGTNGQWTFSRTVLPQTNDAPEPGSLLLMGGALVALALVRRRSKA